ncbi:hypothetical protein [Nocardioides daejeonensis]|uniref:hypothetical protein n=1 Tax=Nocardioides daejeonensis TaxID=1046556 RepID=UPI000D74B9B7|nr:hypothetical protein [Nocardioides daejeonensis]
MTHDHEETEDLTLSVAAQAVADESLTHTAELSAARPGIHLELSELPDTSPDADDWDLDSEADLGLKIMLAGMDPEMAVQLLRVAIEFLEEAEVEED